MAKKNPYVGFMSLYVPGSKLLVLGMVIPALIRNPDNVYIEPHYWVDDFIPYYMEIMGASTPAHKIKEHQRTKVCFIAHLA